MLNNKNILITGGTGTLGKILIDKIVKSFTPKRLIVFSRDELKQSDLQEVYPENKYKFMRYFIGDVRDQERLDLAFKNVDFIFHTAAMKQVIASEYNPEECIKTNIIGAENIIKSSLKNSVKKVIALSTDKAVNPINLYGATKLASDKLFIAANNLSGKNNTNFSIVRYGNVLGSRGSILPKFKQLIQANSKSLPITHEEMTRFIITKEQGADFVINSLRLMRGGEIFVPKIPAVKIINLVRILYPSIKIKIIGIRPGEKLHEILIAKDEFNTVIEFKKYFVIRPSIKFYNVPLDYLNSLEKEKGTLLKEPYEYSSNLSNNFISDNKILSKIKNI